MNLNRILICVGMSWRMLLRRRIVVLLLVVIPAVFLGIVRMTSSDRPLPFRLASLTDEPMIMVSEEGINFVFFAVASVGFLVEVVTKHVVNGNI